MSGTENLFPSTQLLCRCEKNALGWAAVALGRRGIWSISFACRTEREARDWLRKHGGADRAWTGGHASFGDGLRLERQAELLLADLERYVQGSMPDFAVYEIDSTGLTVFQRRVLTACRQIPLGQTASYGELAKQVGAPRAARAVGSVMAGNRVPLVIPCHRVVGSNGRLGGFSAPQGVSMKRLLLDLERGGRAASA